MKRSKLIISMLITAGFSCAALAHTIDGTLGVAAKWQSGYGCLYDRLPNRHGKNVRTGD